MKQNICDKKDYRLGNIVWIFCLFMLLNPSPIRSHFPWIMQGMTIILTIIIFLHPKFYRVILYLESQLLFYIFFLFCIFVIMDHGPTITTFLRQVTKLIPIFCIGLIVSDKRRALKKIMLAMITGVFIVAVGDLFYLLPGALSGAINRQELANLAGTEMMINSDGSWGLGEFMVLYKFMTCFFVLVISSTIWGWVDGIIKKILLCVAQGTILLMLILSSYTSILLLICIAAFLFFFFYMKRENLIKLTVVFFSMLIVLGMFWKTIKEATTGTAYEKMVFRIDSIFSLLIGGGETVAVISGGRDRLASISWNSFINNPLFGIGAYAGQHDYRGFVGGHSTWIDILGQFGLIVALPLFLMLWLWLRDTLMIKKDTWQNEWRTPLIIMWITYFAACLGNTLLFISLLDIYIFYFAGVSVGMYRSQLAGKIDYVESELDVEPVEKYE